MRNLIYVLLAGMLLLGIGTQAQADEGVGKQILRGLVRRGAEAVREKMEKPAEDAAATRHAGPLNMLVPGGGLSGVVREVVAETLEALKEQYKQEGRVYFRQLGDSLAERIVQNPKVQSALNMVKALAWAVCLYLTLVTCLLFWALRRLILSNRRILKLLEECRQQGGGGVPHC